MRLLVDCGNTGVKFAVAEGRQLRAFVRLRPDPEAFAAACAAHEGMIDELALLPGSARNSDLVRAWWAVAGRGRALRVVGAEIPVPEVGQYPGLGLDRIAGGLAAVVQQGGSVLVVDAGTATTFGAWYHDGRGVPPAGCRFLGGLILPSAVACLAGLAAQAPALPLVEPLGPAASAVQRTTIAAIGAGMGIGYGSMVAACLVKLSRETAIRASLLTGGNAGLLLDSLVFPRERLRETLVMEGLALLAEG